MNYNNFFKTYKTLFIFAIISVCLINNTHTMQFASDTKNSLYDAYTRKQYWENWQKNQEEYYRKMLLSSQSIAEAFLNLPKNQHMEFFGASTSHYQIEGNSELITDHNGQLSIDVYKDSIDNNYNTPAQAINFWNNYKTIIPKIKDELKINMLRISIDWSRVQPSKDSFDYNAIEHYVDIVKTLNQYNIEPFITLHHYTNPTWLHETPLVGPFTKREHIKYFVDFAAIMYDALAPYVKYISTINGAEAYAFRAYYAKETVPYEKNLQKTMNVICNIFDAHVEIYKSINRIYQEKQKQGLNISKPIIGIQKVFHPLDISTQGIKGKLALPLSIITTFIGNKIQNDPFDQFFVNGHINIHIPGMVSVDHTNVDAPQCIDFVGINCYANRPMIGYVHDKNVEEKKKTLSKNYYSCPEIIYRAIKTIYTNIVMPLQNTTGKRIAIIITENGIATLNEMQRDSYYRNALLSLYLALKDGFPVIAYLPWTAIDCYEWSSGLTHHYGLIHADFAHENQNKIPQIKQVKPGAKIYANTVGLILNSSEAAS